MPNGLIVLLVIVGISVAISVLSNWLKSQQQTEQAKAAERRSTARRAPAPEARPGKAAGSDIDRFLEEIDKLRKRSAAEASPGAPVVAKPVVAKSARQTAEPAKPKPKRVVGEPPPFATVPPVVQPTAVVPAVPVVSPKRAEQLPVAPVVAAPPRPAAAGSRPTGTASRTAPRSEVTTQLAGLLKGKQGLQMAVVLHEVFGPPKCRRGEPFLAARFSPIRARSKPESL
ncbi:MAG: hypothetical protein U0871_10770 [Gemmataceae bacterium]